MLDAYTLRKTIPRLIIVAIAITLSWPLLEFLVQLSNFLGDSLNALLLSSFSNLTGSLSDNALTSIAVLGGAVAGGSAINGLGALGSLTFIFGALISLLVAFFTLVIRQILLILLIIVSPIAILAYLLPNTEKFFKMWRKTLTSVLVVFPIITLFITTGQIFSKIALSNPTAINQVVGVIAYFIPYLLLPLAFRLAGDLMGALHGGVLGKSKGLNNYAKNFRQNQRKKNKENQYSGQRFTGRFGQTKAGDISNNLLAGLTTGSKGHFGIGRRGRAAREERYATVAREKIEKSPDLKTFFTQDDMGTLLLAASGGDINGFNQAASTLGLTDLEKDEAYQSIMAGPGLNKRSAQIALAHGLAMNGGRAISTLTNRAGGPSNAIVGQTLLNSANRLGVNGTKVWATAQYSGRQTGASTLFAAGGEGLEHSQNVMKELNKLRTDQYSTMKTPEIQHSFDSLNNILEESTDADERHKAAILYRQLVTNFAGSGDGKDIVTQELRNRNVSPYSSPAYSGLVDPSGRPIRTGNTLEDSLVKQVGKPDLDREKLISDSNSGLAYNSDRWP